MDPIKKNTTTKKDVQQLKHIVKQMLRTVSAMRTRTCKIAKKNLTKKSQQQETQNMLHAFAHTKKMTTTEFTNSRARSGITNIQKSHGASA